MAQEITDDIKHIFADDNTMSMFDISNEDHLSGDRTERRNSKYNILNALEEGLSIHKFDMNKHMNDIAKDENKLPLTKNDFEIVEYQVGFIKNTEIDI
jgi:hypothetical protein